MTDEAVRELPARRRFSVGVASSPIRPPDHHRRFLGRILLARARICVVVQSLHGRARPGRRHRHRLRADGGARDGRHESFGGLDRRLRGDDGRLSHADARIADSRRHRGRARARRRARLAQWIRHYPHRRQQLHHHARQRQSLFRRHAHSDQGGSARQSAEGGRRVRKAEDRRRRVAAADHRSGDRLAVVRALPPFRLGAANPRRREPTPAPPKCRASLSIASSRSATLCPACWRRRRG